jgi:transcriptional regulator with XRE-family HTH domain
MENTGQRLHIAMRKKGVDQKTLADYLGLSQASISKIINGKQYLDFDLAIKTCEFLDITLDWLAYGRESSTRTVPFYLNPQRQRIEYLMSVLEEADYEATIIAIEGIIKLRLEREGKTPIGNTDKKGEAEDIKRTG